MNQKRIYGRDFILMRHPDHGIAEVPTDQQTLTERMAAGWTQCAPPAPDAEAAGAGTKEGGPE